jgi:hypothetical protein
VAGLTIARTVGSRTTRLPVRRAPTDALAKEAVLEFATRPWLTTKDPDYVIERLREVLKGPTFLSMRRTRQVLNEIERIYALRTAQREQLLDGYTAAILHPASEQGGRWVYYRHTQSDRSDSDIYRSGNPLLKRCLAIYFHDLLHILAERME